MQRAPRLSRSALLFAALCVAACSSDPEPTTSSTGSSVSSSGNGGTGGGSGGAGGMGGQGGAGGSNTGGGGAGGSMAAFPSDVLNLTDWKLTLPVDTAHAGDPDEI